MTTIQPELQVRADDYLDVRGSYANFSLTSPRWPLIEKAGLVRCERCLVTLTGHAKALYEALEKARRTLPPAMTVTNFDDLLKGEAPQNLPPGG